MHVQRKALSQVFSPGHAFGRAGLGKFSRDAFHGETHASFAHSRSGVHFLRCRLQRQRQHRQCIRRFLESYRKCGDDPARERHHHRRDTGVEHGEGSPYQEEAVPVCCLAGRSGEAHHPRSNRRCHTRLPGHSQGTGKDHEGPRPAQQRSLT